LLHLLLRLHLRRLLRVLRFAAPTLLVVVAASAARDRVHVSADARFQGIGWVASAGGVEVAGSLRDELGQPVGGGDVALSLSVADAARVSGCPSGGRVRVEGPSAFIDTDSFGMFCFHLLEGSAIEGRTLRFAGDRFHGPAESLVPASTGQHRLQLEFESGQLDASLDEPSFVVNVATHLVDGVGTGMTVRLVLAHQPDLGKKEETELAATDVQAGGRARFDIESRALGAPGTGRLTVRFAGGGSLSPVSETALVLRHTRARLALASPVAAADPNQGVELSVGVGSSVGAVDDGFVEASFMGQPAGAGPVQAGAARVIATFSPPRGHPATLLLRYVPEHGGFVAGEPLQVQVALRAPSAWTWFPWLVVALGIAYWVVRAWRRPPRALRPTDHRPKPPPPGHASIDLVEAGSANAGWRGRVLDAHDGDPVLGARVSLVVPVFDGEGVAASHTTAEDGQFALAHVDAAREKGARLVVTAPFHTTLEGPAPVDGVVTIALVSRRRTLLDRLVSWSSRAGRTWNKRGEPTPFEIADVARRRQKTDVATWAVAVGEAAFGVAPPDERREIELTKAEPSLPGSSDER
jgi:hypothetical protein